jgi:hypothetical protein
VRSLRPTDLSGLRHNERIFFLKTKIGRRFLLGFLVVALLTPVVVGWLAIRKAESAIRRQTFVVLRTASDGVEAQLREFLYHFKAQLLHLSQHEQIRKKLELANALKPTPSEISSFLDLLLSQNEKIPDVQEIFVLTLDGRTIASSRVENVGRDYSSCDFFLYLFGTGATGCRLNPTFRPKNHLATPFLRKLCQTKHLS